MDVISGQLANTRVVAKLYDPLYHDHSDYTDPFLYVDLEYARESAAYKYLHDREGKGIPEYYGSYSTEISHPGQGSRTVRLVLVEYVDGVPMTTLPTDVSQDFRKAVMKQVVDIESQLYKINLRHRDIHPQNIIIQGINTDLSKLCIKFIDFGRAAIGRSPDPTDYECDFTLFQHFKVSIALMRFYDNHILQLATCQYFDFNPGEEKCLIVFDKILNRHLLRRQLQVKIPGKAMAVFSNGGDGCSSSPNHLYLLSVSPCPFPFLNAQPPKQKLGFSTPRFSLLMDWPGAFVQACATHPR